MNDATGLAFARSAVFIKGFLDKSIFKQKPKESPSSIFAISFEKVAATMEEISVTERN